MIQNLPLSLSIVFIFITLTTVWMFYKATNHSKLFLLIAVAWLLLQAFAGLSGFYKTSNILPPRFALLAIPPLVFIAIVFATAKGRKFVDSMNIKTLTLLHTIRIPVELVLLALSVYKLVPQLMTFEGRNFDIISGITAPFIVYFGFMKPKLGRKTLLVWNFICLALLLNVVINAVLSLPSPFQQFAFEHPNIAVLYFPFVWLPCCIVPLVLFAHLAAIKQLLNKNKSYDLLRVTLLNNEQNIFRKEGSDAREDE